MSEKHTLGWFCWVCLALMGGVEGFGNGVQVEAFVPNLLSQEMCPICSLSQAAPLKAQKQSTRKTKTQTKRTSPTKTKTPKSQPHGKAREKDDVEKKVHSAIRQNLVEENVEVAIVLYRWCYISPSYF